MFKRRNIATGILVFLLLISAVYNLILCESKNDIQVKYDRERIKNDSLLSVKILVEKDLQKAHLLLKKKES
jgi:hypothetical protein